MCGVRDWDIPVFAVALLTRLLVKVVVYLKYGGYWHNHVVLLGWEVSAHGNSLARYFYVGLCRTRSVCGRERVLRVSFVHLCDLSIKFFGLF